MEKQNHINAQMLEENFKDINCILIISQDDEMAAVWEALYQQKGRVVLRETSVHNALQSARLLRPALIVLDLDLPKLERVNLCRNLRITTNGTLVLLAPKETDHEVFDDYYRAGVDEHLVTPISPMALLVKSMAWLMREGRMAQRA